MRLNKFAIATSALLMLASCGGNIAYAAETMYSTKDGIGIFAEARDNAYVYDIGYVNTSFEVLSIDDGWACITTEDGVAYVQAEHLSPTEIMSYTEEELYLMAHLLAGECQPYPVEEQMYVGSVALNRVASHLFPNNLRDVIYQKGQYACTWDGNFNRTPTERNWAVAKELLTNGSILPENVVFQSKARQGSGVYIETKYHKYCYY